MATGISLRDLSTAGQITGEELMLIDHENKYQKTQDASLMNGKNYYVYDSAINHYTVVSDPKVEDISTYYEKINANKITVSRLSDGLRNINCINKATTTLPTAAEKYRGKIMVVLDDTDGDFVVACVATGQDGSGNVTYAWKKVSLGDAVSPWTIS